MRISIFRGQTLSLHLTYAGPELVLHLFIVMVGDPRPGGPSPCYCMCRHGFR